jgi:hypothetical protein
MASKAVANEGAPNAIFDLTRHGHCVEHIVTHSDQIAVKGER